ncbi:MAG: hypothetical protein CMO55_17295 [Verrucomicrobiales bacterium]|nr:hypothetical protein [Verrucomicrobiales bacterium]
MKSKFALVAVAALLGGVFLGDVSGREIDYHTDIAPLLRDYCSGCHNNYDFEADFSVETFEDLMLGGESEDKTIIVPGKPDDSYLLQTIHKVAEPAMPPKREPQMEDAEIALLTEWVKQGAKGPKPENDVSILSTLTVPEIAPVGGIEKPVTAMEYSPDGKWIAKARFNEGVLVDAKSGKVVRSLKQDDGKINSVHFSRDGKRLVTASGITGLKGVATIWDPGTGKVIQRVGEGMHRDILYDAEFSPDGKLMATAGYDRVIRLWDSKDGEPVREIESHNGAVYDLAFSPDGAILASASGDSTGKLWRVSDGERLDTLNQPQAEQYRIDFTPDGKFVVAVGADNRIRVWRLLSRTEPKINPVLHARFGHEDAIVEMAMSKDGRWLATASADRALKLWSLPDLNPATVYEAQTDVVDSLAFSRSGDELIAARLDGSVEVLSASGFQIARGDGGEGYREAETSASMSSGDPKTNILDETEGEAPVLALPAEVKGTIGEMGDTDEFRFSAKKGEAWIVEVNAERSKSELDSIIAIADSEGKPVERVVLQAMRDSWLTFRGKDSTTSGDFRVQNWREMELNEFLYVNGEVVKLWHYPRGPDSGFLVYPGFGARHTYFGTTAKAHPVGQPCYIVRALAPGAEPSPNGLPLYRIYYENDDDAERMSGKDSKLTFHAPADGEYRVKIADVRGFGGEGYHYALTIRKPQPDFSVSISQKELKISPGSSSEIMFTAKREDGFRGPIQIRVDGLPHGLVSHGPVTIEGDQYRASIPLSATGDFAGVDEEGMKSLSFTAVAEVGTKELTHNVSGLTKIEKGADAKVMVEIQPEGNSGKVGKDGVLEFIIHPGETIMARVVADRLGYNGRITFGKEDAGRNLPHGVYVDNIGLNGLMIPEGKDEQRFFLTAADWVPETEREFFLRTAEDGKQATIPVRLRVVAKDNLAGK